MDQPAIHKLVDHLFRHESGKLVSVLTRIFGVDNIDLAGDVVQDSLVEALSQWQYKGIPDNPSGWLFRVARNKALNILNRDHYQRKYSMAARHGMAADGNSGTGIEDFFSDQEVEDDQLRMIFTCCHPALSADSQIALALKTLCGFSVPEIARAFLTTEENIKKRLHRSKQAIREAGVSFEVPAGEELQQRLDAVLQTIYLLFNEGYSAFAGDQPIRYELCSEAIRLAIMIEQHPAIRDRGSVRALLSLMCLNASRFGARQDAAGRLLTMAEQDRSLWDRSLIAKGISFLGGSAGADHVSSYHLLAAISAQHAIAPDYAATDWQAILRLYDRLVLLERSPVVELNRAIAISMVFGPEAALEALEPLEISLCTYPLFHSARAEFYWQLHSPGEAAECLEKAIRVSTLEKETLWLTERLQSCREKKS